MKWAESEDVNSVSESLGVVQLLTPSVFLMKDGRVGMMIILEGDVVATMGVDQLVESQRRWHQAITSLNDRFSCMVTEYRRKIVIHNKPSERGYFNDLVMNKMENNHLFQNDLFITLIYRPESMLGTKRVSGNGYQVESLIVKLESMIAIFEGILRDFKPKRLSVYPGQQTVDLLSALGLVINAQYERVADYGVLMSQMWQLGINLGEIISRRQVLIGRCVEFKGMSAEKTRWGAIISLKRYPAETALSQEVGLGGLPFEWIGVQSYEPINRVESEKRIQGQISKLVSVADAAVSQRDQLGELRDRVASEAVSLGYHQQIFMVLGETKQALEENLSIMQARLLEGGFIAVREVLGIESAFWAMTPGGVSQGVRKSLITSHNFSHLSVIKGYSSGHRGDNHLHREICILETLAQTPYYFNFHVKGSPENPSLGHTLILGSSNSGKTVLLTYFDLMLSQLGGRRFYFDRDQGAYLYFKAMGLPYLKIDAEMGSVTFNPFSMDGSAQNREFLTGWLTVLATGGQDGLVSSESEVKLRACVDYAYEVLDKPDRTLANALRILPINFEFISQLQRWIGEGEYAHVFDNTVDSLSLSDSLCFDMTFLLDEAPISWQKSVLMYIFYRIEQACTGELCSLFLDEGWQYFNDDYWCRKMRSWLPTLRKKNAHIIIATQSPSTILESSIRDVVLDNCPTQIYFGNEMARKPLYCDGLKLTSSELSCVQTVCCQGRWMLLKHGTDSTIVRLNLSAISSMLPLFSSNAYSCRLYDEIIKKSGNSPDKWVPKLIERLAVYEAH